MVETLPRWVTSHIELLKLTLRVHVSITFNTSALVRSRHTAKPSSSSSSQTPRLPLKGPCELCECERNDLRTFPEVLYHALVKENLRQSACYIYYGAT